MKARYIEQQELDNMRGSAKHVAVADATHEGDTVAFGATLPDGKIVVMEVTVAELTKAVAETALATV